MAVIFEVPVTYTATAIVKFHPNDPTRVPLTDHIPVKVPEVTAERAPLVLRTVDPRGHVVDYREKDGALMRSLTLRIGAEETLVDVTVANAQETLTRYVEAALPRYQTRLPFLPDTYQFPYNAGYEVRRVLESDRADRVQATREAFEYGAAVVDGRLYVPSRGPGWALTHSDVYRVELLEEAAHADNPGPIGLFAPGDVEAAEAQARAWVEEERRNMPRMAVGINLGRTRGAVLTRDQMDAGLDAVPVQLAIAADALMGLGHDAVPEMPPEAIYAYADLKTILAGQREVPPDRTAAARRALADLRDGVRSVPDRLLVRRGDLPALGERLRLADHLIDGEPAPAPATEYR